MVCSRVLLSASGTASCSGTFQSPGVRTITAAYSGDNATLFSSGQAGVSVSQASSSTSVSASTTTPVVGQPVTYTATVAVAPPDTNGPAPTGTVTFTNGATVVCSRAPLSATGTASCSETFESPQAQSISATYSGDSNTFASSGEATATVTKAATSTALSSSPVSPSFGQALTYTATVLLDAPATDGPAPTGTVSFTEGTATVCADVARFQDCSLHGDVFPELSATGEPDGDRYVRRRHQHAYFVGASGPGRKHGDDFYQRVSLARLADALARQSP